MSVYLLLCINNIIIIKVAKTNTGDVTRDMVLIFILLPPLLLSLRAK